MNKNRIVDKIIEVAIGLALTGTVAVLSGLRKDINQLNNTMITVVERLANYEAKLNDEKISTTHSLIELKEAYKDLDNRVRITEQKLSFLKGKNK